MSKFDEDMPVRCGASSLCTNVPTTDVREQIGPNQQIGPMYYCDEHTQEAFSKSFWTHVAVQTKGLHTATRLAVYERYLRRQAERLHTLNDVDLTAFQYAAETYVELRARRREDELER